MVVIHSGVVPLDMKNDVYDYIHVDGSWDYVSTSNTIITYWFGSTRSRALATYQGTNLLGTNPRVTNFSLGYANGSGRIISWTGLSNIDSDDIDKYLLQNFSHSSILSGNDTIGGTEYNDNITGLRGSDLLWGFEGDDIIRAGNGRDTIDGGSGSDTLFGGFGKNTFENMKDGYADTIYLKSDQWAYNYIYGKAGNSPNGEKCDTISDLDSTDRIVVQGVKTSDIVVFQGDSGAVGIFAKDKIEALIPETTLSLSQITSMVSGDLG